MNPVTRLATPALLLCSAVSAAAGDPPITMTPGASIEIAQSAGKFDFLRIDAKRQRLLAAHEKDGTEDIFDLKESKLLTRLKVGDAVDTAIDPDSKFYYVSVQEAARVAVVNADSLKEVASIKTAGPTDAILYDPTNRRLYVTYDGGDAVWVIDPVAAAVVATIVIPGVPEFMVYDDKANKIYLNIKNKDVVAVIDPTSNKVVARWPTAPATAPHGLALDAAAHTVFAAGGNGKLVAIDTATGAVTASVDIVGNVDQIALDAAGGLIYCAGPDRMSVVGSSGGKLSRRGDFATAASAKNVAVDAVTRNVWTTYTDGKNSYAKAWQAPKP